MKQNEENSKKKAQGGGGADTGRAVAGSSGLACSSMRANGLSLRLGGVRQAKRPTADGGSTSETEYNSLLHGIILWERAKKTLNHS